MSEQAATTFSELLASVQEPTTKMLSAKKIARLFGIQLQELAAIVGVHRNTLRSHPELPHIQATLGEIMRLLSTVAELQSGANRALFMVKNQPIPAFRHKTLFQLVQEGRSRDAVGYLESVSGGFVG